MMTTRLKTLGGYMNFTRCRYWKNDFNILTHHVLKIITTKFSNMIYRVRNCFISCPLFTKKHTNRPQINGHVLPNFNYRNEVLAKSFALKSRCAKHIQNKVEIYNLSKKMPQNHTGAKFYRDVMNNNQL